MKESTISKIISLLRDIMNSITSSIDDDDDFPIKVQKRFGFEGPDGWAILTASLDLAGDTEEAKENFYQFGLDGPTRYTNIGERYLRLYGIANAVYLQLSAITNFGGLFKIPDKKKQDSRIRNLRVIEFRHIVGSHTVNFFSSTSKKKEAFMVTRMSLGSHIIKVLTSENNVEQYDLDTIIHEYDEEAIAYLGVVIEKAISSLLAPNSKGRKEFSERLIRIRAEHRGDIFLDNPDGKVVHVRLSTSLGTRGRVSNDKMTKSP